ncbi:MAG: thioredoxin family protein [Gammaproteobacteria bacterium]|jgi:thiol-disulfide isomerase/thioredoxin|nr:thioredoxin family protein [Gammaproteobacteria bacterium]MBT3724745.1 thioredoxin family protein [Gammaproteobacteria bacterium]MBT4078935.1 thioredoxin family protein [Gammaproteobacteria bacterium]MBT4195506.1 thioredoxin family protein [Gammaproteobacteria bacterium]MBT4448772.1 thioredoxin family protein [Gammaproteobacteria bacterium]
MAKITSLIIILLISGFILSSHAVLADEHNKTQTVWRSQDENGNTQVHLYFFWSLNCPHCKDAHPHIEALTNTQPWIKVHSLEISKNRENLNRYRDIALAAGHDTNSVPAFLVCNAMFVGWDGSDGVGKALVETASNCRSENSNLQSDIQVTNLKLPIMGSVDINELSLPVFTLIIAGLDAFNPCAFFILLFLLSLLVHARSRKRMLLVGMTFIFISGVIYFLFMAAWLNIFLLIGSMPYITFFAGLVAFSIGIMNARDYFSLHQKATLSIPKSAKPGLFKRMGGLLSADKLPTLLAGTVTLAIAVNSYELLCTAGFPMVYTRTLTMHQLDSSTYYLYLALYNFIYIIPLTVIVGFFTLTLGAKKLSKNQGRLLKLLSGIMMILLGGILIFAPDLLNNLFTGIGLLVIATLLVTLIWLRRKRI